MKITVSEIDQTQFRVDNHVLNGELVYLVQPQEIGCKWTQQNKIFRSSLWNLDGELISAGFPKFVNWGENPEQFPIPTDLNSCTIVEKIDGSLLVVSKYKGNFIFRTRGTVDAYKLDNGFEINVFKEKYKEFLNLSSADTWAQSFLFEWVSPFQRIILNYGDEPDWYFVGSVLHPNYELLMQKSLDAIAQSYSLKRPNHYSFPSLKELMTNVELWKGKEGVVVYSKQDQTLHKVKSTWYLALHHMKSELSSLEKVLEVWFVLGKPSFQDFFKHIEVHFDFEIANNCQGFISKICEAWREVQKIVLSMTTFISKIKLLSNRKEQALQIISAYGNTNRSSFCFKLLDGKTLMDDDIKKLMWQILKR